MRTKVRLLFAAVLALVIGNVNVTAQMMMAVVQPDKVLIGATEFVPRRFDLPMQLVVPAGQTVELPANSVADYIEVGGTLRVSRTHDTRLLFTHLTVLPGGTLDIGTVADPIPCGVSVQLVVRDVTIDTTKDPYQWGNGLVNFGHQTRVGCTKTAFGATLGPISSGATTVTLSAPPVGWRVGDELLIPDTVQQSMNAAGSALLPARRESVVTIAAINGSTITLSKPLDFSHPDITAPDGTTTLHPRVANLTRNVSIQSENPAGTRGHTVDIGHDVTTDIEYTQMVGLGRTLAVPLNNSTADANGNITHVGTNQVGKYAEHHHHLDSNASGVSTGNVIKGTAKWALVVHSTSDMNVTNNVCTDSPGACFVTEDGNEVRNTFRHNFATYSASTDTTFGTINNPNDSVEKNDSLSNCPGCGGNGFWHKGVENSFIDNEAWNNARGITMFNQDFPAGIKYPSAVGGQPDTLTNPFVANPITFTGNVAASNLFDGLELWSTNPFPMTMVIAYNGVFQASFPISNGNHPNFVNSTVVGDHGSSICLESSNAYSPDFTITGGYVGGCAIGVRGIGHGYLNNTTLQNVINIMWSGGNDTPFEGRLDGVMFLAMPNQPRRDIVFGITPPWPGGDVPLPATGITPFRWQHGSRFTVKNYQRTGQDFRMVGPEQVASNAAWPSYGPNPEGNNEWNCPAVGLTMGQCWQTYGLGIYGEVVDASQLVSMPGLFTWNPKTEFPVDRNGHLTDTLVPFNSFVAGLVPTFGPPRTVMTWPRADVPAYVRPDNTVPMYFAVTGDPALADSTASISIDGATPFPAAPSGDGDLIQFSIPAINGVHQLRAWRRSPSGVVIDSSLMTFQFTVGNVAPPTTGVVPNVVGQTVSQATASITTAGFVVATQTSAVSTTVPAGNVISETPAAGTVAPLGSSVSLVVSSGPPVNVWTTVQVLGPVFWQKFGSQDQFRECIVNETHCLVFP